MLKTVYNAYDRTRRPLREHHYIAFPALGIAYGRIPFAEPVSIHKTLAKLGAEIQRNADPLLSQSQNKTPPPGCGVSGETQGWGDGAELLTARQLQRRYPDIFVFAVVRNPIDRLMACYFANIKTRPSVSASYQRRGFHPQMTFEEFVFRASSISDLRAENHFRSQTSILTHKKALVPTLILRFEQISSEWEKLRAAIQRASKHDIGPYSEAVKPEDAVSQALSAPTSSARAVDRRVITMIQRRYRDDLQHFYAPETIINEISSPLGAQGLSATSSFDVLDGASTTNRETGVYQSPELKALKSRGRKRENI